MFSTKVTNNTNSTNGTNKFRALHTTQHNPIGASPNECNPLLYLVPFMFFVDQSRLTGNTYRLIGWLSASGFVIRCPAKMCAQGNGAKLL